jgi:hypothetical protein
VKPLAVLHFARWRLRPEPGCSCTLRKPCIAHQEYESVGVALADVEALVEAANTLWTYYLLTLPDDKKEQVVAALAPFQAGAEDPGARK